MKNWYSKSYDCRFKDGSVERLYSITFETSDEELYKQCIKWCQSKMDEEWKNERHSK